MQQVGYIDLQRFKLARSSLLAFIAGRHRWVEYASPWDYDAANVPPEWHGWLHHITDHTADQVYPQFRFSKPRLDGLDRPYAC